MHWGMTRANGPLSSTRCRREWHKPRTRKAKKLRRYDWPWVLLFLGPNLVLFLVFMAFPVFYGLYMSFFKWNIVGTPHFIGFSNYVHFFHDPLTPQLAKNSMIFLIGAVIPIIVLSLLSATLLNAVTRFVSFWRGLYFLPLVTSPVAAAAVWRWLYSKDNGLVNYFVTRFGFAAHDWLYNTTWALPAIIIVTIWLALPFNTILYLAGLQEIPRDLYEAAEIRWRVRLAAVPPDHATAPDADDLFRPPDDDHPRLVRLVRHRQCDDTGRPAERDEHLYLQHLSERVPVLPVRLCLGAVVSALRRRLHLHAGELAGPEKVGALLMFRRITRNPADYDAALRDLGRRRADQCRALLLDGFDLAQAALEGLRLPTGMDSEPDQVEQLPEALHVINGRVFLNSIIVSVGIVFFQGLVTTMGGFAFARLRFPFRDQIFLLYLGTILIPSQVTLIPSYIVVVHLGWVNTYQGIIAPVVAHGAFGTFLFRQFFLRIPDEFYEAARLDGANYWQMFWKLTLPLSRPVLSAYGIITFLNAWKLYLWPLIVIRSPQMKVLPMAVAELSGATGEDRAVMMAAVTLTIVPLLALWILAQRWIIQGIASSGLKG